MALRTPLTAQPHLYIGDSTGRPLDYGRVYFGEPNKDPEFYPIDIYLDPEMTIAAAQPVRTKGGFMDVGGNLAELHAAEVIYSLKVLDQYGRQVFYKPEMYRNNVSDFLVDEITRATTAETLIAGNLTAETQRAVAAEKVIADAVVTEKDRAVAAEVALDAKHAALSSTINSLGGGKKAYTTYALMVADKNNIAANSSIDVTNDTDTSKNGNYAYDGTAFTKSPYDPLSLSKVYTDTKKQEAIDAAAIDATSKTLPLVNNSGALIQSNFVYKGYVQSGAVAPTSPTDGDGYIVKTTGDIFGIKVAEGQFLIRNGSRWRVGDRLEVVRRYSNDPVSNQITIASTSDFVFDGLLGATGSFTVSNSYKFTRYIPVTAGDTIGWRTNESPSAASVSYYNEDFVFISAEVLDEGINTIPANTKYARFCHTFSTGITPYGWVKRVSANIATDDLTLIDSENLATTANTVLGKYIGSGGTLYNGTGWKVLKIPVAANEVLTFGNFTIANPGYYSFLNDAGQIVGTWAQFNSSTLPLTVTAPSVNCFLYINIARPADAPALHSQAIVNRGSTLIEYVSPAQSVSAIRGYSIVGANNDTQDFVKSGDDVAFGAVSADSLSTSVLVLNLPTSAVGLDINQAWIDTATSSVKVKLS